MAPRESAEEEVIRYVCDVVLPCLTSAARPADPAAARLASSMASMPRPRPSLPTTSVMIPMSTSTPTLRPSELLSALPSRPFTALTHWSFSLSRIKNPLVGIPRRTLLANVDEFCREKGLEEHQRCIRKGALIAQDPSGYEDITGDEALNEAEIEALRGEVLHKWRCPASLYLTVVTCSIGAAVQGWDQTGSNGANLEFPQAYGIDSNSILDKTIVGLVNAAPYIGTALAGCWLSDPINNTFGRRGTIFLAAQFCLWPVIASSFCNTWVQLFGCRLLLGLGMGTKAATG
jgi:hypothetical protein